MEELHLMDFIFYIGLFLVGTSLLHILSNKLSFPYTVALLITGFIGQLVVHLSGASFHLTLSPDFIYFILLPILLFEAAMHIHIHQFKLQFKTITFLATFGLLLSIFVIGVGLALLLKLPFEIALLFGAIISATDPIAVLALFKTLGAPKRLALIADGESMFNDATGVIAFRVIAGFVVAEQAFQSHALFDSARTFLYVFFGSIVLGVALGYLASMLVRFMRSERFLNAAIITALALGSFSFAEHFFHLSGVITTVIAGIAFGNLARGRMKQNVVEFVQEYFNYLGFLSLSLVFYFASFNLDLGLFTRELPMLFVVVAVVLGARAVSIYGSVFLSNRLPFFHNEPNIPMSWQHILVWGGLRGVIPLVLVYSLPDSFEYKQMMLQFTFATLLFTLCVNGLTIKSLLLKLRLHLPRNEERIIEEELQLFAIDQARKKLHALSRKEFSTDVITSFDVQLMKKEQQYKKDIIALSHTKEFLLSLQIEALAIERETLRKLFAQGRFTEQVLYEFESELDLQQDALEYPHLYTLRVVNKRGEITTKKAFRKRLIMLRRFIVRYHWLGKVLHVTEEDVILERYALLRARLFTSFAVLEYLDRLERSFTKERDVVSGIKTVRQIQNEYVQRNKAQIAELEEKYPTFVKKYQQKIITSLLRIAMHED